MTRNLPPSASVVTHQDGIKLHAPSAARNVDALCEMLETHAPRSGRALEIASGTGQHIVAFAAAFPDVHWQPTEVDAPRRASIDAYAQEAGLRNIAKATDLNATTSGWGHMHSGQDLITLSNLLHLISAPEAQTLITEASKALSTNGTLILYGPFARDGVLTSAGDRDFDAKLRAADPAVGYKDTNDMSQWLTDAGLTLAHVHKMPANNLALISRKAAP